MGRTVVLPIRKSFYTKQKGGGMQIQVLGSGCTNCKRLYEITSAIVADLKLDAKVEYITDVTKIIEMGIMTSPVLAINGKPIMTGFTSDKEKIRAKMVETLQK